MPLLLSLALRLTFPARATDWPDLSTPPPAPGSAANDAALVVGIEDYAFAQDIPGARDNALSWVRWLQARKVPLVKPLLDQQATREELLTSAAQVAARVKPGGTLWLVYIGHGAPSRTEDDGLLVGVDAQQTASSLQARGLSQRELVAAIEGALSSGAQAVLVLDACFSGKTANGDLAPGLAPLNPVSARLSSGRVTALTAARSDEYAGPLPDGRRPAFSYLVLGALRGWGDGDGDRRVSAQEAVSYAGDAMLQTVTGRSQTPTLSGDGSLVLGSGSEAGPDLVALSVAGTKAPVTVDAANIAFFGAAPAVVNSDGDIPGKTVSDLSCGNAHDKSCIEIINDGVQALQIGTSFVGPTGSDGVDNALVKVRGLPQCVFTTGPTGPRCVSVLGPGEHGWVNFPAARLVTITVTWWEMDGLETKSQSVIPGTQVPAIVIGDQRLIGQGSLAMQGEVKVIPKDLRVAGNNILHIKYWWSTPVDGQAVAHTLRSELALAKAAAGSARRGPRRKWTG